MSAAVPAVVATSNSSTSPPTASAAKPDVAADAAASGANSWPKCAPVPGASSVVAAGASSALVPKMLVMSPSPNPGAPSLGGSGGASVLVVPVSPVGGVSVVP